ncbi:MAG: glycoside hydrolase family protein [Cyanobacterium sp. T60_A2020_053]|nr:glycoside hydrolase family protein [Cyanobacterium sp. T60_A2020_053]
MRKSSIVVNLLKTTILVIMIGGIGRLSINENSPPRLKQVQERVINDINARLTGHYDIQPLVMAGGDPYIRALMRTISASEAYTQRPYHVIYGGQYVQKLDRHPDQCVVVKRGANAGKCSTAAGRYQFLNTTWAEKASIYHPQADFIGDNNSYSFEAQYQDEVLYRWLSDGEAWGVDFSQMLAQNQLDQVLRRLSNTWTSLGYGTEDNSMTRRLPKIYQQMLQEELANQQASKN